jgi:hypothetical protein
MMVRHLGLTKLERVVVRENRKLERSLSHRKTHNNKFEPKPNHLRNKLDTTPDPPILPHPTNDFQKLVRFVIQREVSWREERGEAK